MIDYRIRLKMLLCGALMAATLFSASITTQAADVLGDSCIVDVSPIPSISIDDIELATGITFEKYIPAAPPASLDLEFTYSSGLIAVLGSEAAVHQAFEDLAYKLCVEHDNAMGADMSAIELLYNLHHVTDFRPYPYGDPWFAGNGGQNFLLDQKSAFTGHNPHPQSMWNHIDIFVIPLADREVLLAHGIYDGPANPHWPHPNWTGLPDEGEDPSDSLAVNTSNGVVIRVLPRPENNWRGMPNLVHELGHLFGLTMSSWQAGSDAFRLVGGMDEEMRAEAARAAVGVPAFPESFIGQNPPFDNADQIRYVNTVQQGTEDGYDLPRTENYNRGRRWWPYLEEHFNGSSGTLTDDLAHQFITTFVPGSSPGMGTPQISNLYVGTLSRLLEDPVYDNTIAYPYFQHGGNALSGEDRLERLFNNYGIALAVNAPKELSCNN